MDSPLNITGHLLDKLTVTVTHASHKKNYYGWNRTEETPSFNRIYFIAAGEGKVIINGISYYPKPNQLIIMPAGTTQTTETSHENPYDRYFCHFDAHIGEWPLFHGANKLYSCDTQESDWSQMCTTFSDMIEQFQKNDLLSTLRNQANLLNLLVLCLESKGNRDFLRKSLQTSERGKVADVLQYIDQHLNDQIEVEELAQLAHLHPNYFIPYFKKIMGVTPMLYVQQKRMELAKRILSFSDTSISDIAIQVGMELAHFSRYFKKSTGISPSAYRNSTK